MGMKKAKATSRSTRATRTRCPYLVKVKQGKRQVKWCMEYNGECAHIKNCPFKAKAR